MLDRLGKPVVMSAEAETSEIIRRRLFEWDLRAVSQDGRVLLTKGALSAYFDMGNIETVLEELQTNCYFLSGRTYKSALIWSIPDAASGLYDEARKRLAWEDIDAEESDRLDETQRHQLAQSLKKSARDRREAVWRTYKNIGLLGRDNVIRTIDLGLVHSSAAASMAGLILGRLRQDDEAVDGVNPNFLVRNWPPALKTIEVRPDRASVEPGKSLTFTFRGLDQQGQEYPVQGVSWSATGGEMSEDGVFRAGEDEGDYTVSAASGVAKATVRVTVKRRETGSVDKPEPPPADSGIKWSGQVPPQKWMHFYTKVLAKYVNSGALGVRVQVDVNPRGGFSPQQIGEFKAALRELGLDSTKDAWSDW